MRYDLGVSRASPLGRFARIACYSLAVAGVLALYAHFDSPPTPYEELSKRVEDGWKVDEDPPNRTTVAAVHRAPSAMESAMASVPWEGGLLIISTMLLVLVGWRAAHSDTRPTDRSSARRRPLATDDGL